MTASNKKQISRRTLLKGGGIILAGVGVGGAGWAWANHAWAHPQRTLKALKADAFALAWSPKNPQLALLTEDYTLQLWNTSTYTLVHSNPPLTGALSEGGQFANWSPNGKFLALYDSTRYFRVWDVANWTWRPGPKLAVTPARVTSLAWSPDSRFLAIGADGVHVFDVSANAIDKAISTYSEQLNPISALAWSPDGRSIISASGASADGTVKIWDVATGKVQMTHNSPYGYPVATMIQSPDGKLIASTIGTSEDERDPGSEAKAVHVWEAATGVLVSSYHGHSTYVSVLSWSPDGQFIASASGTDDEPNAQVWRPRQSGNGFVYTGHSRAVTGLSWSPDSHTIASASYDGTVQIWQPGG